MNDLAVKARIPGGWRQNALRHSFISYRVALTGDVARTALEAGNAAKMIFRHYREVVEAQTAEAWFAITPPEGWQPSGLDWGSAIGGKSWPFAGKPVRDQIEAHDPQVPLDLFLVGRDEAEKRRDGAEEGFAHVVGVKWSRMVYRVQTSARDWGKDPMSAQAFLIHDVLS
jgi:hypothetical protein